MFAEKAYQTVYDFYLLFCEIVNGDLITLLGAAEIVKRHVENSRHRPQYIERRRRYALFVFAYCCL